MQPDRCMHWAGVEFSPTDLFVDDIDTRHLILAWDQFDVQFGGWGARHRGTGMDLADLIAEVDHAFAATFIEPLANGVDPETILADVRANHTGGFSPDNEYNWDYTFVSDRGPALFFGVSEAPHYRERYERGSDAFWAYGVEIVNGHVTLHARSWLTP